MLHQTSLRLDYLVTTLLKLKKFMPIEFDGWIKRQVQENTICSSTTSRGISSENSLLLLEVHEMSFIQQMCVKSPQICLLPQSVFSATSYHLEVRKQNNVLFNSPQLLI